MRESHLPRQAVRVAGQCARFCYFQGEKGLPDMEFCQVIFGWGVLISGGCSARLTEHPRPTRTTGGLIMQWTAPAFEEICLNCEINSYASAKL